MRIRQGLFAALSLFLVPVTALPQGAAAPVAVAIAEVAEVAEVLQLTGTVTARRDAQLSVATAGLVTALNVDAGDRVARGDVLLELDGELARYQYEGARAAEAQAQRALADARRRLEEARSLAPKQSIAETVVKDIAAEVSEDDAALQRARADVGFRKGILDRHSLIAPFAGVISQRSVELGEWVTPGQSVFALVSTDELRLDLQVPEDYLGRLQAGQQVEFTLGADRDQRYTGEVFATVPVTDPTVRTFLARVQTGAPIPGMRPGMSARAELRLGTGRRGVTVPRDAILRYSDGRQIAWVVEQRDGATIAAERLVQTGFTYDGRIEIRSGLGEGERVVVKGNEALRNGQAVSIRPQQGD